MNKEKKVKICFIGSSGTGKSSIIMKLVNEKFNLDEITQTIGIDFQTKYISIDGEEIKFEFWDTAGQERFDSITKSYYKYGNIFFVIFDLNDFDTEKNIKKWLDKVKDYDCPKIIVGNKKDLIDNNRLKIIKNELENNLNKDIQLVFTSVHDQDSLDDLLDNAITEEIVSRIIYKKIQKEESIIKTDFHEKPVCENKNNKCCKI